jgi:peptidoglycan hydrolase-like protein with peptidoglycan-binding domain
LEVIALQEHTIDVGVEMKRLLRNVLLGTSSVLVLGIAGTALDYAANADNPGDVASPPAISQTSDNLPAGDSFRKDDIRWAQVELRDRRLYRGSLDGILGPATKRAITQFQKNSGLDQTASLDAQTWDALTGNPGIGDGSTILSGTNDTGSATNSSGASSLGR